MIANKADAQAEITKLVGNAKEAIKQAEKLADKYGLTIDWSLAYGMGGTYFPIRTSMDEAEAIQLVRDNKVTDENREEVALALEGNSNWFGSTEGWHSSSSNC
jgi:hypothetical protein